MASSRIAHRPTVVIAETVMTLVTDNDGIPVDAELRYHPHDPFAVKVIFTLPGNDQVEWVFARDLLVGGLVAPTGVGDVQVFPGAYGLYIRLDSPNGSALLVADGPRIAKFLQDTIAAVPLGGEAQLVDLDFELEMFNQPSVLPGDLA